MALALVTATVLVPAGRALAQEEDEQEKQVIIVGTHIRLPLEKEALRVAVGDTDLLSVETLTAKELLVLGRIPGQTTLIVWYRDNTTESFLFVIRPDFSLLEQVLREVHESISVTTAPDRYAVVLRGVVPDVTYSNAAEAIALKYLGASRRDQRPAPSLRAGGEVTGEDGTPPAGAVPPFTETSQAPSNPSVINLIKVQSLPPTLEQRMADVLRSNFGAWVQVQRVLRGPLPDDEKDVFVLSGSVPNQVTLIRVLHLAAATLEGQAGGGETSVEVVADESGALRAKVGEGASGTSGAGGASGAAGLISGGGGTPDNELEANIGRAKALSVAGGRILSYIEVSDLPQVRIDVRFYEVSRSKLQAYSSDFTALWADFDEPSLSPSSGAERIQGAAAQRVGLSGTDVQDVLGYFAGQTTNQLQISGSRAAIDSVLSVLEEKGIARNLSRPSLTVLSGETAQFQVGGEIPVNETFAPTAESGVFNSVSFRSFGVQLRVRPLVGDDGMVTMDLLPQVSLPNSVLTALVRESTGTSPGTTAFETRFLETTARLDDGESLVLAGLVTRRLTENQGMTPGLGEIPLLGWLFGNYDTSEEHTDLVVVVRPAVLRDPDPRSRLWAYPGGLELVRGIASAGVQKETAIVEPAPR
jgi:Flp pilus assembly secretin CpaC